MASVLTLADVKEHLQMASVTGADEYEMARFLEAAETRLSHEVGALSPTTFTEVHRGSPIILRHRPVQSVTSVDGLAPVDVDLSAGIVYDRGYSNSRTVVYVAGYPTLPHDLRMAILEMFRHLWSTQRGTAAGGARAQAFGVVGEAPTTAAGMAAYTLPNRVLEMIRPYTQPTVA